MLASRIGVLRLVVASLAACAASLGAPARCSAQFVGLGTAGAYGIFEEGGSTLSLGGGDITLGVGDVAVGPSGKFNGNSPGGFSGTLTMDPSATFQKNNFTFSGGSTVASLSGAALDYNRALTSLAAQGSGTGFSGTTITGSSDPGSQNVFNFTGGNFNLKDTTFTIAGGANGGANQTFIIDVNGNLSFSNVTVSLTNGVTENHVIFYVASSNTTVTTDDFDGSTFEGTLITSGNGQIQFNNSTLNGALLGTNNMFFGTNGTTVLNSHPFQSAPEPGSLLLGSILAGLCGTVHYVRRRKTAA